MLLNLGCGATRPHDPIWVNVDTLYAELGALSYAQEALRCLHEETNYVDYDLRVMPWPWETGSTDGVLMSHFLEHFDAQTALAMLKEAHRVLSPVGSIRLSVPDATYFRSVYAEDRRQNWKRLFGEDDVHRDAPQQTYMSIALFFEQHQQVFTEDALWCMLVEAGFGAGDVYRTVHGGFTRDTFAARELSGQDNRPRFSLFMEAYK